MNNVVFQLNYRTHSRKTHSRDSICLYQSHPNALFGLTTKIMTFKRQRVCLSVGDKCHRTFTFTEGWRATAPKPRLTCVRATSVLAASEEPGWLPASWKVTEEGKSPSGQPQSANHKAIHQYSDPYRNYNSWQQPGRTMDTQSTDSGLF